MQLKVPETIVRISEGMPKFRLQREKRFRSAKLPPTLNDYLWKSSLISAFQSPSCGISRLDHEMTLTESNGIEIGNYFPYDFTEKDLKPFLMWYFLLLGYFIVSVLEPIFFFVLLIFSPCSQQALRQSFHFFS